MSKTIDKNVLEELLKNLGKTSISEIQTILEKDGIKEFLKDEELKNTANAFFENDLNISKTSKQTFMHRNTLLYRIEKIKKQTSLDIRVFEQATQLKTILVLNKLFAKN